MKGPTPIRTGMRGEEGQALVEFALVIVPLLVLVMGAVDLGLGIFYNNMLNNAARIGARSGILASRTSDDICTRAMAVLSLPGVVATTHCGTAGDLTVQVPQRGTVGPSSTPVKVTLRYTFRPLTPFVAQATGGSVVLNASSTMSVEEAQ